MGKDDMDPGMAGPCMAGLVSRALDHEDNPPSAEPSGAEVYAVSIPDFGKTEGAGYYPAPTVHSGSDEWAAAENACEVALDAAYQRPI